MNPLLSLLRQGITPERLALALALGVVVGTFPVLGTTTILCVAFAAVLRLNQVAVQVGNWIAYPFLLLLIIPFVRIGEWITGAAKFPITPGRLREVAEQGSKVFFATFGDAIVDGVIGWLAVAPLALAALFFVAYPILRRVRPSDQPAPRPSP